MLERYLKKTEFNSYEDFMENYEIEVPNNFNFAYDIVDVIADSDPERQALLWTNPNGDFRTFNFLELKELSNQSANFFLEQGIKRGDKVMLILKRRYQFWYALLGLHKIGATAVPATHLLTKKDIVYRNNASSVKMIVCVNEEEVVKQVNLSRSSSPTLEKVATVGGSSENCIDFDKAIKESSKTLRPLSKEQLPNNDDILLLYFTSGTTGMPKMVAHDYTYPLGHILTAKYWQNVKDGGLHLTVADTGWAKAVWGKIYGQWIGGSSVFVYDYDKFDAKELLRVIEKYKITTFCAPPTIYRFFIKEDMKSFDLSSLEYCVVAGEPLNPEVYNRFREYTGIKLMEGYGQTELTVTLATWPWLEPKPGSMGVASPGYKLKLLKDDGSFCEVGEEGQIVIDTKESKPFGMFLGYYKDEELTNKVWHDDYYFTGDMAWQDEDGFFWFVGRADDVIKSSGYRIGPFEVESALLEHSAVLECAITAVPDPIRGQVVKATIVLSKGYTPSDSLKKELQDHVKKVTAPYKYPRIIEFVETLPKTISGKIRRVEIRSQDK